MYINRRCWLLTTLALLAASSCPAQDPLVRIRQSLDVQSLALTASSGLPAQQTMALARLGALATPDSLAAVRALYDEVRDDPSDRSWSLDDPPERYGPVGGEPVTFEHEGRRYALAIRRPYGLGFYLSWQEPGADGPRWVRPRLLPRLPEAQWEVVSAAVREPDDLQIQCRATVWQNGARSPVGPPIVIGVSLTEALRDSDEDGWTDHEETWFGIDPQQADTDGDGLTDDVDPCPDYHRPAERPANLPEFPNDLLIGVGERVLSDRPLIEHEGADLVRTAVFALCGASRPAVVFWVDEHSPRADLWGESSPVFYNQSGEARRTGRTDDLRGGALLAGPD